MAIQGLASRLPRPGPTLTSLLGLAALVAVILTAFGYIYDRFADDIAYLGARHIRLVGISAGIAVITGLALGILLSRPFMARVAEPIMQVLNVMTTIPTLAIMALSMSALGIGDTAAIFGLWTATLLPIVRNTVAGLQAVDANLIDAGRGMGMTSVQLLLKVEFPNALYVIIAGIRTAVAINVGTAPIAFLIGGTSLGELIFTGIALSDYQMLVAGAVATAVLAIAADILIGAIQHAVVPTGVNPLRRKT